MLTQPTSMAETQTLLDLLSLRSAAQPDRWAYTFLANGEEETQRWTYTELDQQVRRIAAFLQTQGLTAGERALLLFPPGLDYIATFLACLWIGVIAVPAYPPRRNRNLQRIQAILTDAQPRVVLTTQELLQDIQAQLQEHTTAPLDYWATSGLTSDVADQAPYPAESDTLAFLQYTSGSTGTPKGVMISHGNLLHNLAQIYTGFGHSADSLGVIWLPPYHDMGLIGGILQPLYGGFPVVLMPHTAFLQKPLRWIKAISKYRATTSGGPDFAYDLVCRRTTPEQLTGLDLSSWEVAFSGAEPVRAQTLKRFAECFAPHGFRWEAFYPCYGMAETTLMVAGVEKPQPPLILTIDAAALEENRIVQPEEGKPSRDLVGCGRSWADQVVVIVDPESRQRCPEEQVGEIWVAGANVAQGYWQQAETTQATFQAHLTDPPEGPFLRTGDLGFLREGQLFITGRLKDLIIIRGRNHYPQDLELTVQSAHPDLRENAGAAFAVDIEGHEQLVIVQEVERTALRDLDAEAVIKAIRQAVSEQHEVQVYSVALLKTASIPMTSSGKIQRHACRQGFLNQTLEVVGHWTAQLSTWEAEQLQQEIESWEQAQEEETGPMTQERIQDWLLTHLALYLKMPPDQIDVEEPLASYGLDSSVAVSITGELGEWLNQELDPTLFWEYPSIETLAHHLAEIQ